MGNIFSPEDKKYRLSEKWVYSIPGITKKFVDTEMVYVGVGLVKQAGCRPVSKYLDYVNPLAVVETSYTVMSSIIGRGKCQGADPSLIIAKYLPHYPIYPDSFCWIFMEDCGRGLDNDFFIVPMQKRFIDSMAVVGSDKPLFKKIEEYYLDNNEVI